MIRTCRATPGEYRSEYQRDYHGFQREWILKDPEGNTHIHQIGNIYLHK